MKEASFTFSIPLSVRVEQKADGEHLYTEGLISTNDVDLVDDVVTKNFLESMNRQIKERTVKLDIEHEAFKGKTYEEMEINKTKIPAGKILDSDVEKLEKERYGLNVKTEVNRNRSDYKSLKGNLLEKYLDGYSIAFIATEVKYEQRGEKEIRLLDDGILLNVAYTGNACNTKASIRDVFMKSMDALEDYKKMKAKDPEYEKRLIVKSMKAYEKDGAHAHTDDEPLGLHNHPEIENVMRNNNEYLDSRIDRLFSRINDAEEPVVSSEAPLFTKSLTKEQKEMLNDVIKYMEKKFGKKLTKSQSSGNGSDIVGKDKLNSKTIKMTEDNNSGSDPAAEPTGEGEGNGSDDVESKALNTLTADLKSLGEKYDVVIAESKDLKSSLNEIKEAVGKITEAMSKPIHGSPGVQPGDAALKNNAVGKSVDPLALI